MLFDKTSGLKPGEGKITCGITQNTGFGVQKSNSWLNICSPIVILPNNVNILCLFHHIVNFCGLKIPQISEIKFP